MAVLTTALRRLFEDPGPFFSLYLTHDRADGEESWRRLWLQARRQLGELGASAPLLARLEVATGGQPFPVTTHVVVASQRSTFTAGMCATGEEQPVLVRASALPYLLPLLRAQQRAGRVVVAHLGAQADTIAFWPDTDFGVRHRARVTTNLPHPHPHPHPHRRGAGGGPSVGREAVGAAERHLVAALQVAAYEFRPRAVVLVGGGPRVPAVLELMSDRLRRLVLTDPACAAGTAAEAVAAAVALVAERDRRDRDALLALLAAGGAVDGRLALRGARATLGALRAGEIETLLVSELPGPRRPAYYGQALQEVAVEPGELAGGRPAVQADLLDVALRAAAGADADIWVIPAAEGAALPDGLGGLGPPGADPNPDAPWRQELPAGPGAPPAAGLPKPPWEASRRGGVHELAELRRRAEIWRRAVQRSRRRHPSWPTAAS